MMAAGWCPFRFRSRMVYEPTVDPLPRRHNPAAARGTVVHRRIELHQRGQVPLEGDAADPFDSGPGWEVGSYDAYLTSRFASRRAALIEAPFELDTDVRVRGRIDAIYEEEGRWEVVDFKSGRRDDDPSRLVQLQSYAIAAIDFDFGIDRPLSLQLTFAYLGGGVDELTFDADEAWLSEARDALQGLTRGISDNRFDERPGPWCGGCDFLRFCGPGKRHLG
jgi:hypothetical protein